MTNFSFGSYPVLGGKSKGREPRDGPIGCGANDVGKSFFACCVAVGARQASPARPAAISIHNARDVQLGVGWRRHGVSTLVTGSGREDARGATLGTWENRDMAPQATQTPPGLSHVVVAGGTPLEWLEMSTSEWHDRVKAVARAASAEGAQWVTLLPRHGASLSADQLLAYHHLLASVPGMTVVNVLHGERFVWKKDSKLCVIVDPTVDGHQRFAATVEGLRQRGVSPDDVSEASLSVAILEPATDEPDLVVVLGPADEIPDSMVWELAYSELVFLNLEWSKFESSHLELAIDDFNRRHRRFGGLDS